MTTNETVRRFIRTLLQLLAGGGLTWLTDQLAKDLDPQWVPYIVGIYTMAVVLAQNALEDSGAIKPFLKGPPKK